MEQNPIDFKAPDRRPISKTPEIIPPAESTAAQGGLEAADLEPGTHTIGELQNMIEESFRKAEAMKMGGISADSVKDQHYIKIDRKDGHSNITAMNESLPHIFTTYVKEGLRNIMKKLGL